MSKLTFIKQALGYDDEPINSNPRLLGIQRQISFINIPVDNPQTVVVELGPGASSTVFNGSRTIGLDNTSVYSLTLSPANSSTYRLLNTGGTAPVFRTNRSLALSGIAITLSVGANLAVTATAATGTPFTPLQVGDQVFIPGITTGDPAGPFNTLNEGFWTVQVNGTTSIVMVRDPSVVFSGISEVVTPGNNTSFIGFSNDNVQVGDTVALSAGFASSALHAYPITAVTPSWVEFTSTAPLGNQTGVNPNANGISIYTVAKRYLGIETEQEIIYQVNGDTGQFNKITPLIAGSCANGGKPGVFYKFSTVWQLVVTNKSNNLTKITIEMAE